MADSAKKLKKINKNDYNEFACCYGIPVSVKVRFKAHANVWKEGKRTKYCRACVKLYIAEFRASLLKELKSLGAK